MKDFEILVVLALVGGCAGEGLGPDDLDEQGDESGEDAVMLVQQVDGEIAAVRTSVFAGHHAIDDMVFGPMDDDDVLYSLSMEDTDSRWPQGHVPFVLCSVGTTSWAIGCGGEDTWLTGPTNSAVLEAVDYIEARIPGITFERLLNEPPTGTHYITVRNEPDKGESNHAEVGYKGGAPFTTSQRVWLQPMTEPKVGTVVHELGHSLGLRHEHQRADRDDYVAVIWDNIASKEHNYHKLEDETRLTPYDYLSLMHYNGSEFCVKSVIPDEGCQEQEVTYVDGTTFVTVESDKTLIPLQDTLPMQPGDDDKLVTGQLTRHDINGLMQMYPPAPRDGEPFDEFGAAMVLADFDQDGYDDLAVGVPGEDFQLPLQPPVIDTGAVMVFKGTEYGLVPWRELTVVSAGLPLGTGGDEFGAALAAGDIDGDGFPDLLVGAPGRAYGTGHPGAVFAFMGGQHLGANWQGYTTPGCDAPCEYEPRFVPFTSAFEILKPEPLPPDGGRFGAAISTGDLDGDGVDEFAVGAPLSGNSGAVYVWEAIVLADKSVSPSLLGKLAAWEDPDGLPGGEFGAALAIGDVDQGLEGYEHGELLVGSPGSDAVYVFTGKNPTPVERIATDGHEGDRFGASLAIGQFMLTPSQQLVVGAPNREIEGKTGAGAVVLVSGSSLSPMQTVDSPFGEPGAQFGAALAVDDHAFSPDDPAPRDDVFVGVPGYGGGAGRVAVLFATGPKLVLAHEVPAPEFLPLQFGRTLAVGSVKDAAFEFSAPPFSGPARLYAAAPLGTYEGPGGAISVQAGFVRGYMHEEALGLFPRETVTAERQSGFAADD